MKTSESINELSKAMALAQGQMKPAPKDALNPHFKNKYSDISSIWESMRQPLTSNGITVWQDVTTEETKVCVTTRLVHNSGQWVEFGPLCIPLSKKDAHGIGSAITYAKRYALCASIGVVQGDEDDDGNEAIKNVQTSVQTLIPKKKIEELQNMVSRCSPEYIKWFADNLKTSGTTLETISKDWYDSLYAETYKFLDAQAKAQDGPRPTPGPGNQPSI